MSRISYFFSCLRVREVIFYQCNTQGYFLMHVCVQTLEVCMLVQSSDFNRIEGATIPPWHAAL